MASNLADIQFRVRRVTPLENNPLAVVLDELELHSLSESPAEDGFRLAEAYSHSGKSLLKLSLHEARLGRRFTRLMIEFQAQQEARNSAHVATFERASYHAKYAERRQLDYDPQTNGFAFSKTNLDRFNSHPAETARNVCPSPWQAVQLRTLCTAVPF